MILNKTVPSKEDPFFLFPFKTLFDGDHFLLIYIYIYIYIILLKQVFNPDWDHKYFISRKKDKMYIFLVRGKFVVEAYRKKYL